MANGIKLAHCFALLLSPSSLYFQSKYPNSKSRQFEWKHNDFIGVFGVRLDVVKELALSEGPKRMTERLAQKIADSVQLYRFKCREKLARGISEEFRPTLEHLLRCDEITVKDLYSHGSLGAGDNVVHDFGRKLGLTRRDVYIAVDQARNTKPKANCGIYLEKQRGLEAFEKAKGVYLVIAPNTVTRDDTIKISTLRVSHYLQTNVNKKSSPIWIRTKLNLPNYHYQDTYQLRYQYRGYLTPSNHDHCWSINMAQAPYSIDREDFQGFKSPGKFNEVDSYSGELITNISDHLSISFRNPERNRIITGLMTSLGQRSDLGSVGSQRSPYSAKVYAIQVYPGSFDEEETRFMKKGIGFFKGVDDVLSHFEEEVHVTKSDALTRIEACTKLYIKYLKNHTKEALQFPVQLSENENFLFPSLVDGE